MDTWTQLRDQFPVTRRWAYLDHAAVAPLSAPAQRAMCEHAMDVVENGVVHEPLWNRRMEEVRHLAAQLLAAEPSEIAFVKNTSEGIGFVAEGFPWQQGDNVITAAEEYPANLYPWMNLARRGVELRMVPSRGNRIVIDDLRAVMDDRTRVVALSFVEFASGFRNDLDTIGSLCRERGVFFFVDAIQGLGHLPLDVSKTPIDALSADGHKWLVAPEGAALFWIRRDVMDRIHPVGVGWKNVVGARDFSTIDFRFRSDAARYESGTLYVAGIHALGASLELLLKSNINAIADRIYSLTEYLCEKARTAGIEVFSSRAAAEWSGIVSLVMPTLDVRSVMKRCRQEGVVVNVRAGRLRVSPHCYNTREEMERLIEVLTRSATVGNTTP